MTKKIAAAAVLALLTVSAPAHAAYVDTIDLELNLTYPANPVGSRSGGQLTGTLDLDRNIYYNPNTAALNPGDPPYGFGPLPSQLYFNGNPLTLDAPGTGNDGYLGDVFFYSGGLPYALIINTADIGDLTYLDFAHATGGTVTVLSETYTTPLPAALSLFGSGLAGLNGAGWVRRRKVRELT
jgi:hypothetical protein